jgi:hypothetical protein
VLSVVGDLEDHGADQVAVVEDLQVDLHVVWNLTLSLLLLVLSRLIDISAVALSQEFLVLGVVADVNE